ncbi:MAG: GNAT family N-acetyltransferase [Devosia sp.]
MGFRAKRLRGLDDPFLAHLDAWAKTAFQTRGFLATLAATTAPAFGAELTLIGVEDAQGAPVAVFPFTLSRERGVTVAEAVGLGCSDYFVPVTPDSGPLDARDASAVWDAVLGALPPADVARLRNVPRDYDGAEHAFSGATFLSPMGHCASIMPIAPGEKGSGDAKRKLNKLQKQGAVEFACPTDAAGRDELLDAMFAMRRARFAEMGRSDYLEQPGVQDFYRQLAADPIVHLSGLKVDGQVIAVVYGLLHKGRFTLLIPTMTADERWAPFSPGLVAMHLVIEHGRAAGWHMFDFSVGDLQYKSRFGAQKVELFEVQRALSLRGVVPVMVARLRSAARTMRMRRQMRVVEAG